MVLVPCLTASRRQGIQVGQHNTFDGFIQLEVKNYDRLSLDIAPKFTALVSSLTFFTITDISQNNLHISISTRVYISGHLIDNRV